MERMSQEDGEKFDMELMKPLPGQEESDADREFELEQLKQFL